jgi:putative aldouronate transport system permease protein
LKTSLGSKVFVHLAMTLMSLFCFLPFVLLCMASITDEKEILHRGYSFFPHQFSFEAYAYLWNDASSIGRAYGITILVTVIGTAAGLLIISMLSYPISRKELPFRNFFSFFVFFTMLFNGGLVSTYLVYTHLIDVKNTLWALIIPGLLLNGFYVILMRTFFSGSIPPQIVESAYIDGAGEFKIYYQIIMPLSLPVLATVGLFQSIAYWNDWFNGLIYITDSRYYSLQNLLNRILLDIQFLTDNAQMGASAGDMMANTPTESVRMAMAVIGIIPIVLAYPFFQQYFVKGLTIGAVKG